MAKIRKSQYRKSCVFDRFDEVSEGFAKDVVDVLSVPFRDGDPLGEVRCALSREDTKCVRGLCPHWNTYTLMKDLKNRIGLADRIDSLGTRFESLALKVDVGNPSDDVRRELASIRNELRQLRENKGFSELRDVKCADYQEQNKR